MLYFIYFTSISKYIFFICAYLLTLNCRWLGKDGGRWTRTRRWRGRRSTLGWRRRRSRTMSYNNRWSSRPLPMRHSRTMTTLSRTPLGLAPQVRYTSTCEVPRVSLSGRYFVTGTRLFDLMGKVCNFRCCRCFYILYVQI
jgi:hypothetical protein